MNHTCKVTLFPKTFRHYGPYKKCGQPVVNTERQLCAQHQADRVRLGGTS